MALIEQVKGLKEKRALVVGDAMLDHNVHGACTRLSPEGPYKVLHVQDHEFLLGGAANVAHNMAALGASTTLCYVAGADEAGKRLEETAKRKGLDVLAIKDDGRKTVEKIRLFAGDIRMDPRIDEESVHGIEKDIETEVVARVKGELSRVHVLLLSDYNKGMFKGSLARKLIDEARKQGVLVVVEPKPSSFAPELNKFDKANVVIMNNKEASTITGIAYDGEESLNAMGEKVLGTAEFDYVVITCGKDGMFCMDKEGRTCMIKTKARKVSDVTGAGDTSAAILSLAIAAGLQIEDALRVANYGAGIVVGKPGTATVTLEELKERIGQDT